VSASNTTLVIFTVITLALQVIGSFLRMWRRGSSRNNTFEQENQNMKKKLSHFFECFFAAPPTLERKSETKRQLHLIKVSVALFLFSGSTDHPFWTLGTGERGERPI